MHNPIHMCTRQNTKKRCFVIIYVGYGLRTTSSHMTCHTWEINNKLIDNSPLFFISDRLSAPATDLSLQPHSQ